MLLGVDDFATEQLYHRGKMRLHNAWLHRAGVVWGFGVSLDLQHGEIRVLPGLVLNASGHELHLDTEACLNVVEWFSAHKDDEGFAPATIATGVKFDAHVEIRFKSCLTRQVPALLEPCEGGSAGTHVLARFRDRRNPAAAWQGPRARRADRNDLDDQLFGTFSRCLAKTLVESTCRAVLGERSIVFGENDDLPKLFKMATGTLRPRGPATKVVLRKLVMTAFGSEVDGQAILRERLPAYSTPRERVWRTAARLFSRHFAFSFDLGKKASINNVVYL